MNVEGLQLGDAWKFNLMGDLTRQSWPATVATVTVADNLLAAE